MKGLIILIVLVPILLFGQPQVRTNPTVHDWVTVFDDTLVTRDTTTAISAKAWEGVSTMFIDWDELVSGDASDSCLTIEIELYHGAGKNEVLEPNGPDDVGIGWAKYYTGTAVSGLVDTVARGTEGVYSIYIDIGADNTWAMADSARAILYIGTGDSSLIRVEWGGQ